MVGNAVRRYVLNHTKGEIVAVLGTSEDNGQFVELRPDLAYKTGPRRDSAFLQGNEWLLIWVHDNPEMVRFEIVEIQG